MKFSDIEKLLKNNPAPSSWGKTQEFNELILFCLEDINLRLVTNLEWNQGKPFQVLKIIYSSTELGFIPIQMPTDETEASNVNQLLSVALDFMRDTTSVMNNP